MIEGAIGLKRTRLHRESTVGSRRDGFAVTNTITLFGGGFFEGFQEGILRGRVHEVRVVDYYNATAPFYGRVRKNNCISRTRLDPYPSLIRSFADNVGMCALEDTPAARTSLLFIFRATRAVEFRGKTYRGHLLADSLHTGKQVRVGYPFIPSGTFKEGHGSFMPQDSVHLSESDTIYVPGSNTNGPSKE